MYRYSINAKDKNNPRYPFIDGDNYWIDADSEAEAKRRLESREGLHHHELIVYGRETIK